ncbi:MAG: DUF192 domain-containing protein [Bacteriovoracaceae bacterium]|nr:DUF192 domain-containing protein [Bacteriovoracaceae bacterium]
MASMQVVWEKSSGERVILAREVELATNFFARAKGLLGRAFLPPEKGLLIRPCNSIHTFFMRFPIDVIFLNRRNEVVKILRNLPAGRVTWPNWATYQVLELAAQVVPSDLQPKARLDLCINS